MNLFAKKTKIESGKWLYRGYIIFKVGKVWDIENKDGKFRDMELTKTIKAICVLIDKEIGGVVTANDTEKTKLNNIDIVRTDCAHKDILYILSNSFSKTRKIFYIKTDNVITSITFEIQASDASFNMMDYVLKANFESDIVKAKRKEIVSLKENVSVYDIKQRMLDASFALIDINAKKDLLAKSFSGYELVLEREKIFGGWFKVAFDVFYETNDFIATPNTPHTKNHKRDDIDDNYSDFFLVKN